MEARHPFAKLSDPLSFIRNHAPNNQPKPQRYVRGKVTTESREASPQKLRSLSTHKRVRNTKARDYVNTNAMKRGRKGSIGVGNGNRRKREISRAIRYRPDGNRYP